MRCDLGLGAEPAPGCIKAQHIAQRHQRHALVVRHKGLDDAEGLPFGLARGGEVERFEHAQFASPAQRFEPPQIGHRRCRFKQRGQHSGVRRHHAVGQRRAPHRQTRNAKRRILVGQ